MTIESDPIATSATLPQLLAAAVEKWPEKVFLRIDGCDVSFAEFDAQVAALAGALRERGLGRGDRLSVFMGNSLACVQTWFAANRLGAVWVPINTEWRGAGLLHAVRLAAPAVVIADRDLAAHLRGALGPMGDGVLLEANGAGTVPSLDHVLGASPVEDVAEVDFADDAGMLYTSGTTGRSKACVLSHRYFVSQAAIATRDFGLRPDDVLYCPFPLFHSDASALTVVPALLFGSTAAIGRRFSASRFWGEVRSVGATVFDFMGATLSILQKAPHRDDDADNPVRLAWGVPVPPWAPQFESRFGLQLIELYGSVEASIPITQRFDRPRVPGSCGRLIPEFEAAIVDIHDEAVPVGQVGELVVRPKVPFTTLTGYFGDSAATTAAFRNLWLHTGDYLRVDADGNFSFVGRTSDSIRRRGENISAHEVEEGLLAHPSVLECAAVGVPSELTEEDVKVFVVVRPGHDFDVDDMLAFCRDTMARFQVPRYLELVDALPKTPTGKISKLSLRDRPAVGPSGWDLESERAGDVDQSAVGLQASAPSARLGGYE
jgi:acyl-CoA synthetase (AMP-forming)/AMP-acid ligase II